VTDETLCLAAFLDKSGLIHDYFSKVEKETLKKRLKEVRESEAYTSAKQVLDEITAVYVVIAITVNAGA
jgi:DNA polymerase III delta prime subunit